MNHQLMKRTAAMALAAALLLGGSASALFGKKPETPQVVEGAPVARDIDISTYKNIPYQAQLLASDSEGRTSPLLWRRSRKREWWKLTA